MKTKKITLGFLVALSLSLLVISCKKDNLGGTGGIIIPPATTNGSIVDYGVLTADIRHMNVTLTDVSLTIDGMTPGSNMGTSQVVLDMFTNADGVIMDGTYSLASTNDVTPFTFKNGIVYIANADTNNTDSFGITSGNITLVRDGTNYQISIEGSLSNGNPVLGTFAGSLSYTDNEQPSY
jgi:hypothetical protein